MRSPKEFSQRVSVKEMHGKFEGFPFYSALFGLVI